MTAGRGYPTGRRRAGRSCRPAREGDMAQVLMHAGLLPAPAGGTRTRCSAGTIGYAAEWTRPSSSTATSSTAEK